MLSRAFRVTQRGDIDDKKFRKLKEIVKAKSWWYKPVMIGLSLNVSHGSIIQSKNIAHFQHGLARKHSVPLYTFTEDICLGSGNILLSSGHKAFANPYSIIGEYAYRHDWVGQKKFATQYNIDVTTIKAGKFKDKLNPFVDLRAADAEFVENMLKERQYELRKEVIKGRANAFATLRLTNEEIDEKIFSKDFITAQTALELKLVDEISTFDEVVAHRFQGSKILDINLSTDSKDISSSLYAQEEEIQNLLAFEYKNTSSNY